MARAVPDIPFFHLVSNYEEKQKRLMVVGLNSRMINVFCVGAALLAVTVTTTTARADNYHGAPAISSDFSITCQTDVLFIPLSGAPLSEVRECTLHTYGTFSKPIELTCEASASLSNIDCEMSPASIIIEDQHSAMDVTVRVQVGGDNSVHEKGGVLVKATYGMDDRATSIPVVIENELPGVMGPPAKLEGNPDFFLLSGQSNMVGYTTTRLSIGQNANYWMNLMRLFEDAEQNGATETWKNDLFNTIRDAGADTGQTNGPESVIQTLTNEIVKLQALGLLDGIGEPLALGK